MRPSTHFPPVTLAPDATAADRAAAAVFGVPEAATRDPAAWQLVRSGRSLALCGPAGPDAVVVALDLAQGPLSRRLRQARRDDLLHGKEVLQRTWILRKHLADMNSVEAMEFVKKHMEGTKSNEEFLVSMNS
jgi:hypothetical protein